MDTTTPVGEFTANVVASAAQYKRRLIGQRTRDALAAKCSAGVGLGRPSGLPADVPARIVVERAEGRSMPEICQSLEADGVPAARGGDRWYPSSVDAVLRSQDAAALSH